MKRRCPIEWDAAGPGAAGVSFVVFEVSTHSIDAGLMGTNPAVAFGAALNWVGV